MQVDREVTLEKFQREVAILRGRFDELARLGCYVVRVEFPCIDVIVTPVQQVAFGVASLRAAAAIIESGAPGAEQEVQLQAYAVPPRFSFTLMPFGIRISLDDFDLRAPSYSFRHPTKWELMPVDQLPPALLESEGKQMNVLLGNHAVTKGTFFCMRGVREYHEHPEHTGDEWLLFRDSINVFSTLTQIVRCCQKPLPIIVVNPPQLLVRFGAH